MKQDRNSMTGPTDSVAQSQKMQLPRLQTSIAPMLWSPRFSASTLSHRPPRLCSLTSLLRPERAAVIGLDRGTEFFAPRQALNRTGQVAQCIGCAVAGPHAGREDAIPAPVADPAAEF